MENSMKRHYYNDPLAAAWMAKHHKFKLQYADIGGAMHDLDCRTMLQDELEIPSNPRLCRVYVHPDSAPLLEPEGTDLCEVEYDDGFCNCRVVENWGYSQLSGKRPELKLIAILRRRGKPFFMPDSESA
jgi:hypothetical protein